MLKVLLKKQLTEIFRGHYYDAKKNTGRSRGAVIGRFIAYFVVMGGVLILGLIFSLIMLLVDIVYAFVDPRIKAQYEGRKGKK